MADVKKTEGKPNIFVRFVQRGTKWFREMRAELKKVVWPTPKQLVNNTGIVLGTIILIGAIISLFGVAATQGFSLLIGLAG